jgi:hypothetical protein
MQLSNTLQKLCACSLHLYFNLCGSCADKVARTEKFHLYLDFAFFCCFYILVYRFCSHWLFFHGFKCAPCFCVCFVISRLVSYCCGKLTFNSLVESPEQLSRSIFTLHVPFLLALLTISNFPCCCSQREQRLRALLFCSTRCQIICMHLLIKQVQATAYSGSLGK